MNQAAVNAIRIVDYVSKNEGCKVSKACADMMLTISQLNNARSLITEIKAVRGDARQVRWYLKDTPVLMRTKKEIGQEYRARPKTRLQNELRSIKLKKLREAIKQESFENRVMPAHPPILTMWQPVKAWAIAIL